jgi:hypothetical protein
MRIFIAKTNTSLQELTGSLLRKPADAGGALDRVMALNPHVEDFQKLSAGTVLILPDGPELKAGAGTTVGGEGLDDMAADLTRGIKAVGSRAGNRLDDLKADRSAVVAALKTVGAKRIVDSDPALAKRLEAAEAQFKVEQKLATETQAQLAGLQKTALAEFARLQKMLGQ